jgi:hypothetical protein
MTSEQPSTNPIMRIEKLLQGPAAQASIDIVHGKIRPNPGEKSTEKPELLPDTVAVSRRPTQRANGTTPSGRESHRAGHEVGRDRISHKAVASSSARSRP